MIFNHFQNVIIIHLDAILEAELKKLPSHEALTKQAEDYLTYLDKKSLRIGSQVIEKGLKLNISDDCSGILLHFSSFDLRNEGVRDKPRDQGGLLEAKVIQIIYISKLMKAISGLRRRPTKNGGQGQLSRNVSEQNDRPWHAHNWIS